ncbi:RNA-directed DNA polymerase [Bhargavaea ullalensis]|uniref:Reverse transcriptase domain-containing protein n=1 Tax=Bhargavaea ullalensis TaxID=1265685 RepID=A0ABV2GB82_9BACL
MRENLFLRTETLPEELPLLFSNKAVYRNFSKKDIEEIWRIDSNFDKNKFNKAFISLITIPYYFYIPKNELEKRKMSLVHPLAQVQMFYFTLKYEQLITAFCSQSSFSVRSPIAKNRPLYNPKKKQDYLNKKMEGEFSFSKEQTITTEENEILFYSFFSYNKYRNLQGLINSPKFNRDKYNFNNFMKIDIQSFFPSIYTHSLAWAIFGDKPLAKKLKNVKEAFGNAIDNLNQKINFNETNGIIVGPEFSRITSEILLTRLDINILNTLTNKGLKLKKHYTIYRFIDDYFIFSHNKEVLLLIKGVIEDELQVYNLRLKQDKLQIQEKPFRIHKPVINILNNCFDIFNSKLIRYNNYVENNSSVSRWHESIWRSLFENVETLLIDYPNERTRIVNYFLKKVQSFISLNSVTNKYNASYILEHIVNLYTISITHKSTSLVIENFLKVTKKVGEVSDWDKQEKNNNYLDEKIFQHIYRSLKNNSNKIDQMYDLIAFLKVLKKKLSSSFLIKIIKKYNKNYFVLCSVAYYILNDDNSDIYRSYLTVQKFLSNNIFEYINEFDEKGDLPLILDSEYFYVLNDFSFYPGFNTKERKNLKNIIKRQLKDYHFSDNESKLWQEDAFKKILSSSYYNWGASKDDFTKEVAKKTLLASSRRLDY